MMEENLYQQLDRFITALRRFANDDGRLLEWASRVAAAEGERDPTYPDFF